MFINIVRLQSTNNSGPNAILLSRLKQIQIKTEKRVEPNKTREELGDAIRSLTPQRLLKLVNYHYQDPLTWNTDILSRIFNIPEHYCDSLVKYVQPMVYKYDNKSRDAYKLVQTKIVIDVARMRGDKSYMKHLQILVFPQVDVQRLSQEMKIINKGLVN